MVNKNNEMGATGTKVAFSSMYANLNIFISLLKFVILAQTLHPGAVKSIPEAF